MWKVSELSGVGGNLGEVLAVAKSRLNGGMKNPTGFFRTATRPAWAISANAGEFPIVTTKSRCRTGPRRRGSGIAIIRLGRNEYGMR
jgi:hypothetical protein